MKQAHKKAARRTRHPIDTEPARSPSALLKSVLLALFVSMATGLLLLVITTSVLLCTKDPDAYRPVMGPVLLYLTALIGGILATALYHKRSPVLCGAAEGLLLLLITLLPALFWQMPEQGQTARTLLLRCLILPISLLGALLCSKKPKKRKNFRR